MSVPLRAIVVDDSEDDTTLMLRALKRGGYAVESARVDTAAALSEAIGQKTWDLILSDQDMPDFNALGALTVRNDLAPDAAFIIVSGRIGEEAIVAAMKLGAQDYVLKRDLGRLVPAVERALREVAARVSARRAEEALRASEARLRRSEEELRDKLEIIQRQLDVITEQQEAIRLLSTPIIDVWDGVLMTPVLGSLSRERATSMMDLVLTEVARTRSHYVIIDLTGVDAVDVETAEHIIRLVAAVELLGARGLVVGIKPQVATAITASGLDLSRITTLARLRDALVYCMRVRTRPALISPHAR
jgi:anti-anti-sigma regulatory factor/CheY-like chemotaxis protein